MLTTNSKNEKVMKKIFVVLATLALAVGCGKIDQGISGEKLVVTGYSSAQTRTAFGEPDAEQIPFLWSKGDYIWLGENRSEAIAEDCKLAHFEFKAGTAVVGTGHLFYNMTGQAKSAKVLAEQTADGNLGNDGDFGYATLDEYNAFFLKHKTAYVWFDTTTTDSDMPKLSSITLSAPEGVNIAGERVYDFANDTWAEAVANGSNAIKINFEGGYALQPANEGVMAAMVCLPAAVAGKELIITYAFENGTVFTEVKTPSSDFVAGATQRVKTVVAKSALVEPEPELDYELRYLTFEDEDAKFTPYTLDYAGVEIGKWSDLVDDAQYGGTLTYANYSAETYYWYDEGNTELYHSFTTPYWGGGHVISNYVIEDYENLPDGYLGWYELQMANPIGGHNGSANFAVHNGYSDFFNSQIYDASLNGFEFADGVERVVDHMYVTNTNYVLNSLTYGDGFNMPATEDTYLKVIAYGYNADNEEVGSLEFTLCNGASNILRTWQKWDLSALGKVAKIVFNFSASADQVGSYGLNCPAYFAYDDVAVRFEK